MTGYILLIAGFAPFIILLLTYVIHIHPNRKILRTTFRKLGLPNKVGAISLIVAILAFFYSILYSSISTYLSIKTIQAADLGATEQKKSFDEQLRIMKTQQMVLEANKKSLDASLILAKAQVDNLNKTAKSLQEMVKTNEGQLDILNEQKMAQIRDEKKKPKFALAILSKGEKLSEKYFYNKLYKVETDENNKLDLDVLVENIGDKVARKVVIVATGFPSESVDMFKRGLSKNDIHNTVSLLDFIDLALLPKKSGFIYALSSVIPEKIDTVKFSIKVFCDEVNVQEELKLKFVVDHSKSKVLSQ